MADRREGERKEGERKESRDIEERERKAKNAAAVRQSREGHKRDLQRLKEIQEQKKRQEEEKKRREMKIVSLKRQEEYMKKVFSKMNEKNPAFGRYQGVSRYL